MAQNSSTTTLPFRLTQSALAPGGACNSLNVSKSGAGVPFSGCAHSETVPSRNERNQAVSQQIHLSVDTEYAPLVPDLKRELTHPKSIRGWTFIGDSPWLFSLKELCTRIPYLDAVHLVMATIQSELGKKVVVSVRRGVWPAIANKRGSVGLGGLKTRTFLAELGGPQSLLGNRTVRVTEENWNEAFLLSIRREVMFNKTIFSTLCQCRIRLAELTEHVRPESD